MERVAIWKNIPREQLNDVAELQNMLSKDVLELLIKYEQLIEDNNLDPTKYHMAIRFSDQDGDNFIKNRVTIVMYPELNEDIASGGNYKDAGSSTP